MEKICCLTGKITGLAYEGYSSVKIKFECIKVCVKEAEEPDWHEVILPSLVNTFTVPYTGPVSLSHKQRQEFAFKKETVMSIYGFGEPISSLNIGDEAEIYALLHCGDGSRFVLTKVIVFSQEDKLPSIEEFIKKHFNL